MSWLNPYQSLLLTLILLLQASIILYQFHFLALIYLSSRVNIPNGRISGIYFSRRLCPMKVFQMYSVYII